MLGQPALVTAHGGGDAQCEALLAQQRVAAVARAIRPDLARFGVVHDVLGLVARPGHVLLAGFQRSAHGVHAGNEVAFHTQHVVHGTAHAGHDLHVHGDVGAVGQFDADVGDGRAQRAHAERHHVHGAALHATVEQGLQRGAHLGWGHPVVGGASVFLLGGADVGAVFHTGDVARVGPGEVAAGALGRVELLEGAGIDQLLAQAVVLFLGAVAPVDGVGLAEDRHVGDPGEQAGVFDVCGGLEIQALHGGCVHGELPEVEKRSFQRKLPTSGATRGPAHGSSERCL